jgi:hypothetical protein|tara:strand:- start:5810 stop:5983 length:174 start_codon:yes stop_codon:yes gene_type:complete
MILYAIVIEPFDDGTEYVKEGSIWSVETPVKLFDTKEAAEEEAKRWNTGKVVEWSTP